MTKTPVAPLLLHFTQTKAQISSFILHFSVHSFNLLVQATNWAISLSVSFLHFSLSTYQSRSSFIFSSFAHIFSCIVIVVANQNLLSGLVTSKLHALCNKGEKKKKKDKMNVLTFLLASLLCCSER